MGQAVLLNRGGTIETHFLDGRPTSVLVSLFNGDGAIKVDTQAATLDTVATAISLSAAKGATALTLASATGVVVGRRYLVGAPSGNQPREAVTIRELNTSTATLWAPLNYNHASGASFGCTRATYAVASTSCDVLWWDGYMDFTPNVGDVITETVDCVLRKIPETLIDETDLLDVLPKAQKILDAETDLPSAIRKAREEFMRYFGGKNRANCALGADHFRRPCALTFWILRRYALGDQWKAEVDLMEKERDMLIGKIQSQIPFDNDQDGVTDSRNDGGFTVITMGRA